MTEKSKQESTAQRAAGWCKAERERLPNTFVSCTPNGFFPQVGCDGFARYARTASCRKMPFKMVNRGGTATKLALLRKRKGLFSFQFFSRHPERSRNFGVSAEIASHKGERDLAKIDYKKEI